MHLSNCKSSKTRLIALTVATSAVLAISAQAHDSHHDSHHGHGVGQSGEQKNMLRVGHSDIQGREAYQPNVITYPDGRVIAFIGTHGGTHFNPLTDMDEPNGTMIVDITNPRKPKDVYHIPNMLGGTNQMARMCLGSDLPGGVPGKVYLMRNFGTGYETFDVTDVHAPVLLQSFSSVPGVINSFSSTHKLWWECTTGIAYLPARPNGWRQRGLVIVDWSNPAQPPMYIRTFGLPGQQPGSTIEPVPPSPHGAISAEDAFPGKNRVYVAWGTGSNGVVQILDREKLLHDPLVDPNNPSDQELLSPQVGRLDMSPDQGGHTTMPVFGLQPKSYQNFTESTTRDILVVSSESTSNLCQEAPHWAFTVDMTTEDKMWNLATMWVDPRSGEKYPRGNYCTRGARFGVHSSEENFNNPCYGRLTFLAYFTGGVRAWDIREPQGPVEVGFYVGESNANTGPTGYMTNNVEVDDRGYIITADRVGSGMDVIKLTNGASKICFANSRDRYYYDNDDNYDYYDHRKHH